MNKELFLCIARKIADHRRQLGMSQRIFARKIGISPSYLSKIECGRGVDGTSLEILCSIALGLQLSPDRLLFISKTDRSMAAAFLARREKRARKRALLLKKIQ